MTALDGVAIDTAAASAPVAVAVANATAREIGTLDALIVAVFLVLTSKGSTTWSPVEVALPTTTVPVSTEPKARLSDSTAKFLAVPEGSAQRYQALVNGDGFSIQGGGIRLLGCVPSRQFAI